MMISVARLLSPSSFAFNDSNYDNENANAGSRSHLCLRICMRRGPHLLVKNDDSNGVGRSYPKALIRNKGL